MAKTKRVDPIKQREKRAKIMAAGGVVLLLAVGGYEIPTVMKGTKPVTAPPPSTTVSLPTLPASGASAAQSAKPSAGNPYGNPDAIPVLASNNQLVSFSLFESKNPFRPQVTTTATTTPPADTSGASPTDTTTTPTSTTAGGTIVPPTGGGTTPASTTPAASAPTVTILVNGTKSTVAAEGTFPSSSPVFRLASFTSSSAEVGIVGGSYATGGATLTLQLDKPVTLENTTDGKRYTLELVATH